MEYPFKLGATGVIWIMSAIMVGSTSAGSNTMGDPFRMVIILAIIIGASIATRSIWGGVESSSMSQRRAERYADRYASYEKPKQDPKQKLQHMMNALDDDEAAALLEDFRARLSTDAGDGSDGEISAVDALRAERRSRR